MYTTKWAQIKKDGTLRRGEYTTKEKTAYHDGLHDRCDYAFSGEVRGIMHFMDKETKSLAYVAHMETRKAQRIAKTQARERLEAAAPALLEAAEWALQVIGDFRGKVRAEVMSDTAMQKLRDAIAAAKGVR